MTDLPNETVLLICNDEDYSFLLLDRLNGAGFSVVGPAQDSATALTLAAQRPATLALHASPPEGEGGASELAADLMRTWGMRSLLLRDARDADLDVGEDIDWALQPARRERLARAVRGERSEA